jgi:hypothetical protein
LNLGDALTKVTQRWTDQEFAGLDLGDARLNKRARTLMERFAAKPTASIPEACDNWSETCAAYRFLGKEEVSSEGILARTGNACANTRSCCAFNRDPLGVLDAWMWAREMRDADGVRHGQKESARWIEGYERVAKMTANVADIRLVYVADREADLVAMMGRARELDTPVDWLVRA